jgi:peptidoglycan/LPS O-acetylase OafA/YrhL
VGTGWSLSSEWLAYVCFPLLALGAWRIRRAHPAITGVLAVAVLVPYAYVSYRSGSNVHDWMAVTRIAGGFTAGVLACLAVRRIPRTVRTQRWAAGICTLTLVELGVAILWAEWRSEAFPGADYYGVAIVFLPVLVGSLALSTTGVAAFLSRPVMVHGGRISFALYLVHIAVFEVGRTVADHVQRLGGSTAIGAVLLPQLLIVSVVAAHLLYRYVEEPTRRALRDRTPAGLRRWPAADVPSDVPPAVPPAVPAAREPVSEAA